MLDERVLSAIIEFIVELPKLPQVIEALKKVGNKVDTVFSVDLICRVGKGDSIPTLPKLLYGGYRLGAP